MGALVLQLRLVSGILDHLRLSETSGQAQDLRGSPALEIQLQPETHKQAFSQVDGHLDGLKSTHPVMQLQPFQLPAAMRSHLQPVQPVQAQPVRPPVHRPARVHINHSSTKIHSVSSSVKFRNTSVTTTSA